MHDPTSRLEPDTRAARLRTAALASAVALVIALPLAFVVAGPSDTIGLSRTPVGSAASLDGESDADEGEDAAMAPAPAPHAADTSSPSTEAEAGRPGSPAGAFCGTERRASDGVEAQACVLTQGPDTWGRVHYRNATGAPLRAELTVRRPDGETVDVTCEIPATGESGLCETPREPTVADPGSGDEPADDDSSADPGEDPGEDTDEDASEGTGEDAGQGDEPGPDGGRPSSSDGDGGWSDESYAVEARLTDVDGERVVLTVSGDRDTT